jgi:hypothetical protein
MPASPVFARNFSPVTQPPTTSPTPTFAQLTINGAAGNGTNVTTAAIPVTITPFYPQTISFTVAGTNGPYEGQTFNLSWSPNPGGYPVDGTYDGVSSDGQFEGVFVPTSVGGGSLNVADSATGWNPLNAGSITPHDNIRGIATVGWTPGGGFTGTITWTDENGNPNTFDASAMGGTGTATPVIIDQGGNLSGMMSVRPTSIDTTQVLASILSGAFATDLSGGANTGHAYWSDGSVWHQLDN